MAKNIKILKLTKRRAEKRLVYLNPDHILSRSAMTIGVSIVSFLLALQLYSLPFYVPHLLFLLSIVALAWVIIIFGNSIRIIIEASSAAQGIRKTTEEKIIELLTTLVDNSESNDLPLFIEHKYLSVLFHNEKITEGKEYTFSVNKRHKVKVSLTNSSEYMLKTAELGFTFQTEFLIEGGTISHTYTGDKEKIIRFRHDYIHAKEIRDEGDIDITFLRVGTFNVNAFVKGENLKRKTINFIIKVIE